MCLSSATLALAQNGLTIAPGTLPYGVVGNGYSAIINSNGSPNTTWNLVAGSFPPGLAITSAGSSATVEGTPTTTGTYPFTVSATDPQRNGATTSQQFSITIVQMLPPSPLPNAAINAPYSETFTMSLGGNFIWQSLNPPPGLTMNLQGTLSGSPTMTGTFTFNVTATPIETVNFVGPPVSAEFQLTVIPGLVFTSSVILPNGVAGQNYSYPLLAAGGTQPYTFSLEPSGVIQNVLPPNLTLSSGGLISGIPTSAGYYGVTIDLTDANKITISAYFQLTIAPPLLITTPSPLSTATLQAGYPQSITVTGGNPPYTFSLAKGSGPIPPGMTFQSNGSFTGSPTVTGLYTFTVLTTDSAGYTATKQFQLTVAPAGALLQVAPSQITFTGIAGDTDFPPTPQIVSIVATSGAPVNYAATIQGAPGSPMPPWLNVTPLAGAAPGAVLVSVNSVFTSQGTVTTLTPGNYPATIQITVPNNTSQAPINVQVSFTVTAGTPTAHVAPSMLRFAARADAPSTQEQVIVMQDSGGGGAPTATVVGNSPWITLPKSSSSLSVRVDANSTGLSVGDHHDIVRLANSAGTFDVPVSLFVANGGPIMALGVTGLRFQSRQGAGTTEGQAVSVLNLGDSGSTVNFAVDLVSGSDWLTFGFPSSGTATPTQPGSFVLIPSPNTAGLPAGPQYALVRVRDPQSQNSPQYVAVVLDNQPATSPALPDPQPAGLYFASTTGSQIVFLNTSSTTPVQFAASTATSDGANWLSVTPTSGNASTSSAGQLSVSITPSAAAGPGIYHGSVNISMGGELRVVNVTMVAPSPGTVNAAFRAATTSSSCTPSHLAITQTGLVNNFTIPLGLPASLIVQLNDDCGNPVSNGSVVVSFSNGDPPMTLAGDHSTNVYSATWQPAAPFSQMTVTVTASAGMLPQSMQQFTGTVSGNATPPPSLVANGALNIFFDNPTANATGRALAPGGVIQVYGSGFAPALISPGVVPLQNQISGTYMLIGSTQVPLFFVSGAVLAAQVPFEIPVNQQYPAVVSVNNALTLPETLNIVAMQPGVDFNVADQTVLAQRLDGSLVSAANPAHPGESLTLYLAGMGATNPAVPTGSATPQQTLVATQPTVTLNGETVNVGYAGLTPTGIGLYQINLTVPTDAPAGLLDLAIMQGTVAANATKLPVGSN